jgi:AraC-like DNA-binding protein
MLANSAIKPPVFFGLRAPLEPMPTGRQMRIANLGAFPALAREFRVDHRSILERYDIDPLQLRNPDHLIDCTAFTGVLEDCSSSFNAPLFGLKLAQLHEPEVYGCVIALCRSASTVREAIESFIEYIRLTHSSASFQELIEGEQTAELRWFVRTDLGRNQQANFHAALLIAKLLRQIGGRSFKLSYVNLAVETRNKDIDELERRFGCRFHSTAANNAIAFPKELLDQSVVSASRLVFTLLSGYLGKLRATSEISIVEKVENYIRGALPSGNCCIEHCAQRLGVAVRTLQTKLRESGREFSAILEQQRLDMAKTYLKQKQLSLDDVAINLGYTEQSGFCRAFKRWTGTTPRLYRQAIDL